MSCWFPVGSGAAGSVVAARLSEDPSIRVLVLEAGDDDLRYPSIPVPGKARDLWGSTASWDDYTVSQRNACLGMKNNVSHHYSLPMSFHPCDCLYFLLVAMSMAPWQSPGWRHQCQFYAVCARQPTWFWLMGCPWVHRLVLWRGLALLQEIREYARQQNEEFRWVVPWY